MNDIARPMPKRRALIGAAAVAALGAGVAAYLRHTAPVEGIEIHAVPQALPPLRFADASGKPVDLAAWRGRAVLLNVWATWCSPCRQEMPALDRLQAALGGPRFEVVALSIDSGGLPAVQAFFRSTGVRHLRPYLDTGHDAAQLAVGSIPLTLLIDPQGREVARKRGAARWDDPAAQTLSALFDMTKLLLGRFRRAALPAALLAILGAPALAAPDATITHAWARPTVPGQPVGAAYFDLRSEHGATVTGLHSDAAAGVQLHSMQRDGDIMRMRELTSLPLPPGETVRLAPGGTHAMLLQLKRPLKAGETIGLDLSLTDAAGHRGTVHVDVPVSATAPRGSAP